jgi:hypothetical protein
VTAIQYIFLSVVYFGLRKSFDRFSHGLLIAEIPSGEGEREESGKSREEGEDE